MIAKVKENSLNPSYKGKNKQVPQDFADYIVERDYVMAALRTMKEMDADEADWKRMAFLYWLCKAISPYFMARNKIYFPDT